jgi:predicted permease
MDTLLREIRHAGRSLRRAPAFTAAALLTLSLGIGATSAIFTIVNAALLKPLPYPEPGRLFVLAPPQGRSLSGQLFLHVRDRAQLFERISAQRGGGGMHLVDRGYAEYVATQRVSEGFFETHDVPLLLGRGFSYAEDQPGGPDAAIIGEALWRRAFGGTPDVLGRTILLGDVPHVVVGVAPGSFGSIPEADLWTPLRTTPSDNGANYRVIGRLRSGVTHAQATAELDGLRSTMRAEFPRYGAGAIASLQWIPYREYVGIGVRQMLQILLGAVLFLLLIACVNVASLQLTRALARRREVAVRMALGGTRSRVARQAVIESLLLAAAGAAVGLAIGVGVTRLLAGLVSEQLSRQMLSGAPLTLDWRVLGFTAGVALVSGAIFGIAPALASSRADSRTVLAEGSTSTSSRRTVWLRRSLAGAELALACILLVGAGLLVRTFTNLAGSDLGFNPSGILVGRMSLQGAIGAETLESLLRDGLARVRGVPGVQSASASNGVPVERAINLPLRPPAGGLVADVRSVDWRYVTEDYFEVFEIRPIVGRVFDGRDRAGAPSVAIVNEAFARTYFGRVNVVGETVTLAAGPERPRQIVGVVRDAKARSGSGWTGGLTALGSAAAPTLFEPAGQAAANMGGTGRRVFDLTWAVRSSSGRPGIQGELQQAVRSVDSRLLFIAFEPMDAVVARDLDVPRFVASLFAGFGLLAIVLAAVGLYGLMAYAASQRTREVGIRLALGSTAPRIARQFVVEGLAIASAGLLLGLIGAAATTRALGQLLFGVTPLDAATFAAVGLLLLLVAAVATTVPAVRAARTDPVEALRTE